MLRWGKKTASVLSASLLAVGALLGVDAAGPTVPAAHAAETITTDRLAGADRYATAIAASKSAYPGEADTVYLATGLDYADALVAGPAAAKERGPLLLTRPSGLNAAVAAEIDRLNPSKVVVVGGTGAIGRDVVRSVEELGPRVERRGGANRYETADAVVRGAFDAADQAYVATGLNYADALSASAVAASRNAPVLLVRGTASTVPAATEETLRDLGVTSTVVTGGPAIVSHPIVSELGEFGPRRVYGPDRFETNRRLNAELVQTSIRAYLATGFDYPDALACAAVAGAQKSPLYLARPHCVADGIATDLQASPVARLTLVGGAGVLSDDAGRLASCTPRWQFNADLPKSSATVLQQLETIPVKGRAPKTGYTRAEFGPTWADVDNNSCDTRNDILRRDLRDIVLGSVSGCRNHTVMSGILDDPYTGTTIGFQRGVGTSNTVQIDHVVALSDAWQKGAQQMTERNRTLFANDPLNLLAVDGPANGSKGDSDAATWLPPNKVIRCDYVTRQTAVKAKYGLWVTQAEHDAIETVVTTKCPGQKALAVTPVK
ncbi:hypothetical protein GCM10022377_26750 [Zhihengliuella alba]|uniref:GmrSD restriction endonucleases C-terminal domain-containing protein n=1 Tax=Zhihengliuella alba TaxID=547018 RepID=A0ABP7E4B0_9MICC